MGSRSNIAIHFGNDDHGQPQRVYLYSHWDGEAIAKHLRDACKAGARLNDAQYFARIVFQRMLGTDKGESGYGISPGICDNQYKVLVVNCDQDRVTVEDGEGNVVDGREWTLGAFGELDDGAAVAAMT